LCRAHSIGTDAPQVHRQLSSDRYDGFLAGSSRGQRFFGQQVSPFFNRSIVWLEADQALGCFDQRRSQARIAMFDHAALYAGIAADL